MRLLVIGLFCAALALGCGGGEPPAPAAASNDPSGKTHKPGDKSTVAPKGGGPKLTPPPLPNVGPPPK